MFKNHLKIAVRSLLKNKVYTSINIIGLGVGLACCILIVLHIQDETSYDKFHPNGDRLFRMVLERIYPDYTTFYAVIPHGFARAVLIEIPEIQKTTRLAGFPHLSSIVTYEDKVFEENYIFFADSNFFDVFKFELLQGDPKTALSNPGTVVLTESTARKYFGTENPIGQTIKINNDSLEVSAVMQNIPKNSHIKFDFLASIIGQQFFDEPNYVGFSSYTYLELVEGTDPKTVEAKFPDVVDKYASGQIERNLGISYEEYVAAGNGYRYFLQNVGDIHLHSNLEMEIKPTGSILYIYLFMTIAVFILIIACINFVNLATAQSTERAKEVGLRKMMGSHRTQLVRQFLMESTMMSLLSLVFAIALVHYLLPVFNNLTQKQLLFNLFSIKPLLLLTCFTLLVGMLAGLYPAFFVSSLEPAAVLKGKFKSSARGRVLRNGLVIFQFAISIILIIGTFVVYSQLGYIQNKRLGFDRENVLVIERFGAVEQPEAFKHAVREVPDVQSVGATSTMPGGVHFGIQLRMPEGSDVLTANGLVADDNFLNTIGLTIVDGRGFSEEFNDSLSLILNQRAVSVLGLDDPIGARLNSNLNTGDGQVQVNLRVVGVIENYHFESLHTEITPLVILHSDGPFAFQANVAVRLQSRNIQHSLERIESVWNDFAPDQPFIFSFFDTNLAALYKSEQTSSKIFGLFSIVAIIIACVGLFGLVTFTVFQRTKEIGIRKTLGATVPNIVILLSLDFTKLVAIAFIIASLPSYLLMRSWLENFAYRIEMSPLIVLLGGSTALLLAIATILFQVVKAALKNPVETLRYE